MRMVNQMKSAEWEEERFSFPLLRLFARWFPARPVDEGGDAGGGGVVVLSDQPGHNAFETYLVALLVFLTAGALHFHWLRSWNTEAVWIPGLLVAGMLAGLLSIHVLGVVCVLAAAALRRFLPRRIRPRAVSGCAFIVLLSLGCAVETPPPFIHRPVLFAWLVFVALNVLAWFVLTALGPTRRTGR